MVGRGAVPDAVRDRGDAQVRRSLAGGGKIAFDHADPPHLLPPERRTAAEATAERVAAAGEPFLIYLTAEDASDLLRLHGFAHVKDHGPRDMAWVWQAAPKWMPDRGGHVAIARTA